MKISSHLKKVRADLNKLRKSQPDFSKEKVVAHEAYCIVDNYISEVEKKPDVEETLSDVVKLLPPKLKEIYKRFIK